MTLNCISKFEIFGQRTLGKFLSLYIIVGDAFTNDVLVKSRYVEF